MPRRQRSYDHDADDFGPTNLPSHAHESEAHAETIETLENEAKIVSHPALQRKAYLHPAMLGNATPQTILTLQRQHGNRAVQRWVANYSAQPNQVNRQPKNPLSPVPTPKNPLAPGPAKGDDPDQDFADQVSGEFQEFMVGLAQAQNRNNSNYRQTMSLRLVRETNMEPFVSMGVFDSPSLHIPEITFVAQKLHELKSEMQQEAKRAQTEQFRLAGLYWDAHGKLEMRGVAADVAALQVLEKASNDASKLISENGDFASTEDLDQFAYMLKHETHIKSGDIEAKREDQKLRDEMDKIYGDMAALRDEDDPGLASNIWSIIGWDSFGEFLLDVGLTVATGGLGKAYKVGKKANKARKLSKLRKGVKAARLAKRIKKLESMGEAALGMVNALKENPAAVTNIMGWVRENGKSLAKKIATDMAAATAATASTDKVLGQASVASARLRKEYIQYLVDEYMDLSGDLSTEYVRMMFAASIAGRKDSSSRMLQAFLNVSLRRRGMANLLHASFNHVGKLDFPDNVEDFKDIGFDLANVAITTAGEMLNDFVIALPYIAEYKDFLEPYIEAVRKYLVNLIRSTIGN